MWSKDLQKRSTNRRGLAVLVDRLCNFCPNKTAGIPNPAQGAVSASFLCEPHRLEERDLDWNSALSGRLRVNGPCPDIRYGCGPIRVIWKVTTQPVFGILSDLFAPIPDFARKLRTVFGRVFDQDFVQEHGYRPL
jgi:hypothetical protein